MPIQEINKPTEDDKLSGWTGPGWYFWDESVNLHGPYSTKQMCEEQETWYARQLEAMSTSEERNVYVMSEKELIAETLELRKRMALMRQLLPYQYQRGFERGFEAMRQEGIKILSQPISKQEKR